MTDNKEEKEKENAPGITIKFWNSKRFLLIFLLLRISNQNGTTKTHGIL